MDNQTLSNLREDYRSAPFGITDVADDPFVQFNQWMEAAIQHQQPEPNAMTLATVDASGQPSARIVLLKGILEGGFVFYTNYESRKGQDLAVQTKAALVFCWLGMARQVRIEGECVRLSASASDAYFQSRPKGSQIGAWASPQSQIIPDRQLLENKVEELNSTYATSDALPRPAHWGGYVLKPHMIEFWQGRSSRLHDRIRYQKEGEESWKLDRLAP